jgi:uncharacterized cofD-like protein
MEGGPTLVRLRWLQPGLGVKRWGLLILAGAALMATGTAQTVSPRRLGNLYHRLSALDLALVALGLAAVALGVVFLVRSLALALAPDRKEGLGEFLWRNRVRLRGPKIVALGGGTGLSVLLKGMKNFTTSLTAVVTVADDGGSSGRLRRDMDVLPPGDVRNCLVALARSEDLLSRLFQYRFQRGGDLVGHSFGNLLIAALSDITGDFVKAIKVSSDVLAIVGEVLPSTCDNVVLRAVLEDGTRVEGETNIGRSGKRIRELQLFPVDPEPPPTVVERIRSAEIILLGPGSLFTSVIPNLLVPAIARAINQTSVPVVYVANIMTQPGETDRFRLSDHLEAIFRLTALRRVDYVLFNSGPIERRKLRFYRSRGAVPVELDASVQVARPGTRVVEEDLVSVLDYIRHDSSKLAVSVMKIVERNMSRGVRTLRARRA